MLVREFWVSDQHRAIFQPVPKVGATSLKTALLPIFGYEIGNGSVHSVRPTFRNPSQIDNFAGHRLVCFVRHPLPRLLSCYRNKIRPGIESPGFVDGVAKPLAKLNVFQADMSFSDFVSAVCSIPPDETDPHLAPQSLLLGHHEFDFYGRFELLTEDFTRLCTLLGIENPSLPHLNPTGAQSHVAEAYRDGATADRAAEYYNVDLSEFGYAVDDIIAG